MVENNRKLKVFLCHASDDKPAVRELYQRLSAEDWIDPWLDEEKLLPGQDWDLEIEKAVEETDAVIVCLSTKGVSKEGYVQKEIKIALNAALFMPEDMIFIVPLRLDECKTPRHLRNIQYIDYFPKDREDWAYTRLLKGLGERARRIGLTLEETADGHLKVVKRSEKTKVSVGSFTVMHTELKSCDLVRVNGRLDSSTSPKLRELFESVVAAKRFRIVCDLEDLEYMSSSGFRVLLSTQRECKRYNRGEIVLSSIPERVYEALDLAGFIELFKIFDDPIVAVDSFYLDSK
jgi:anti-sigma B factor antagonist